MIFASACIGTLSLPPCRSDAARRPAVRSVWIDHRKRVLVSPADPQRARCGALEGQGQLIALERPGRAPAGSVGVAPVGGELTGLVAVMTVGPAADQEGAVDGRRQRRGGGDGVGIVGE